MVCSNSRMAQIVVPFLEEPAIARAPEGKLPSEGDFIRILWHHQGGNFQGFQGIIDVE